MRRAFVMAALATTVLASSGCRGKWPLGWRAPIEQRAAPVAWSSLDPNAVQIIPDGEYGVVRYRIHLPTAEEGAANRLAMVFESPLEGAKVDAHGDGPGHAQSLVREKRVGNNVVIVPLGSMAWDTVDVVVHHHLRQPPIVHAVRVAARPPAQEVGVQRR